MAVSSQKLRLIAVLSGGIPTPPPGYRLIVSIVNGFPRYLTTIVNGKRYYIIAPEA